MPKFQSNRAMKALLHYNGWAEFWLVAVNHRWIFLKTQTVGEMAASIEL
jgi:hypothetical protein